MCACTKDTKGRSEQINICLLSARIKVLCYHAQPQTCILCLWHILCPFLGVGLFSFLKKFHLHIYASVCVGACKARRSPEAGAPGDCKLFYVGAGNQIQVLWRAASALNHCAISPAPFSFFFFVTGFWVAQADLKLIPIPLPWLHNNWDFIFTFMIKRNLSVKVPASMPHNWVWSLGSKGRRKGLTPAKVLT